MCRSDSWLNGILRSREAQLCGPLRFFVCLSFGFFFLGGGAGRNRDGWVFVLFDERFITSSVPVMPLFACVYTANILFDCELSGTL